MRGEIETYIALLERRLSLLRMLAQQFMDCRKDFVSMDLDGMYARIAEQEDLCRQIQALHPAIDRLQRTCVKHLGLDQPDQGNALENAAWAGRLRRVMQELGEAQTEIGRLNQIHACYLRRSRQTIQVLMNSLGMCAVTYAPGMETVGVSVQTEEKGI